MQRDQNVFFQCSSLLWYGYLVSTVVDVVVVVVVVVVFTSLLGKLPHDHLTRLIGLLKDREFSCVSMVASTTSIQPT